MRREDLIRILAKKLDCTKQEAKTILDQIITTIKEGLLKDKKVLLKSIGLFTIQERKPKIGRLIKENKPIRIPARNVVKFSASRLLIKLLNE
jgi:DNA-binding protein HU-beta